MKAAIPDMIRTAAASLCLLVMFTCFSFLPLLVFAACHGPAILYKELNSQERDSRQLRLLMSMSRVFVENTGVFRRDAT